MLPWVLRFVALIVVSVSLFVQFTADDGWGAIAGMVLWPLIGLVHLIAHSVRLPRSGPISGSRIALISVSHLFLILGFLLQYDQGDSLGWLTITSLLEKMSLRSNNYPPAWWPDGLKNNFALFLPVFVTWVLLIAYPWRAASSSAPVD
jgi:hypothetical protein